MVVLGVFDEVRDAEYAIAALKALTVPADEISILAHPEAIPGTNRARPVTQPSTGVAMTTAGMVATLVGIGLCAIPLAGLLTAGPLMLAGGIASVAESSRPIDDMREYGVPFEDAKLAMENVRRGGIAVLARVDRSMVRRVSEAMDRSNAVDFRQRALEWENEGWEFQPNAPPYRAEEIARERARRAEVQQPSPEPPLVEQRPYGQPAVLHERVSRDF
jgi:hypothetical protein